MGDNWPKSWKVLLNALKIRWKYLIKRGKEWQKVDQKIIKNLWKIDKNWAKLWKKMNENHRQFGTNLNKNY